MGKPKKKEWSAETFYNRGKPQKHGAVSEHYLKELRYKRPHIVWFHLYEKPNIGKPVETDSLIAQSVNRSEWVLSHLNHLWLFAIPGTVARQAPLSMGFFSQEHWIGFLPPGDLFWLRDGACVSCVVCSGSEFFTTSATWWLILSDENLYVVQCRGHGFKSWVRKIPWRRKWLPTPVSCLGNTMDRGTWRATVHGVLRVRHDFHHRHIEKESSVLVYRDGRRVRKWRFDLGRVFLEAGENISELSKRTSLVVWWIRIRLPMQGTWVWSLVQEDPTCWGAAEPVHRNFWGWALEPALCNKRSHHKEKPKHCNQREASTCPN